MVLKDSRMHECLTASGSKNTLAADAADVDRARAVARIGDHRHQRLFFNFLVLIV